MFKIPQVEYGSVWLKSGFKQLQNIQKIVRKIAFVTIASSVAESLLKSYVIQKLKLMGRPNY